MERSGSSQPAPSLRRHSHRSLRAAVTLAATLSLALIVSGAGTVFPLGHEAVVQDNSVQHFLVINPPQGSEPTCGCPDGTLKVTIPAFALVRASPTFGASLLGVTEQGQLMCMLEQDLQGWSKVQLPGACDATGWVEPDTFRTLRVQVADDGTTIAPDDTPPAVTPTLTPPADSGDDVTGSGSLTISQSLTVAIGLVTGAGGLVTVNDEGSAFTVAVETTTGSTFELKLALRNASNSPLIGELQLQGIDGLQVTATAADGVTGIARVGADTWKLTMAASHSNLTPDVTLKIKVTGGPGFLTIRGALRQVAF